MGHGIIAAIALGVSRVTEKDTRNGTGGEFVRGGGSDTGVTTTTKDPKIIIRGRGTKKKVVWRVVPTSTTRTEVDEEGGGGEGVGPKGRWDVTVEEKGADAVVEGAEHTLGTTILLRGIGTS
jgi:hypothetical protein